MSDAEQVAAPLALGAEGESPARTLSTSTAMPAIALALAACDSAGGGGDGGLISTPGPAPTPTPTPPPISTAQASRFLAQATMGATKAQINDVIARGYSGWLDDQFGRARLVTHWDWLVANGYSDAAFVNNQQGFDNAMWSQLVTAPDQLRQRVGMALLELLVVGIDGVNLNWRQFAMAAYVDVLMDNAFGNYRTILDKISTNAAMGSFLTFLGNRRANTSTGAMPDENYARELMQLFTLGLHRLNADGSVQTANGAPIETYTQTDVSQLARIFTGLSLDSSDSATPDRYRRPLVFNNGLRETGSSTVLGTSISGADGPAALRQALDTIFAHPNLPPFVSKQLIQRLVSSNPSPAYVGRVSAVFANNGSGVRGDMPAVIRAILLDSEARADPSGTSGGKLREPVMRLTSWARAFAAASPSGLWAIGDTSSSTTRLAQSMGRSGSVFNFFRPGYTPPRTGIATAGLVAPEFQITNELSVVAYVNFMQGLIQNGINDVRADYAEMLAKLPDSQALVDEINALLAAGQLSAATVATIKTAVDSHATANNKVWIAILLTMASPEFIALK